jgi:glycerol-3-phosphate dehydrogenase (NAD(P)+)
MWGTTLAVQLARAGRSVRWLVRTEQEATQLRRSGENKRFLPGIDIPSDICISSHPSEALAGSTVALLVVPSEAMRANTRWIGPYLADNTIFVSATKGLDTGDGKTMSALILDELPEIDSGRVMVLSGPNLAREIAQGQPAAAVLAGTDAALTKEAREVLMMPHFRIYTSTDVAGVELGGALKNVMAIVAGICDGLGLGDNAKAAVLTRGVAEMTRLGVAMGAQPLTFAGLAGLGDLMATCASRQSRNRHVGERLAAGKTLSTILESMENVAEGVPTTRAAVRLARTRGVELPISELLHEVLFGDTAVAQAAAELLERAPRDELEDFKLA